MRWLMVLGLLTIMGASRVLALSDGTEATGFMTTSELYDDCRVAVELAEAGEDWNPRSYCAGRIQGALEVMSLYNFIPIETALNESSEQKNCERCRNEIIEKINKRICLPKIKKNKTKNPVLIIANDFVKWWKKEPNHKQLQLRNTELSAFFLNQYQCY